MELGKGEPLSKAALRSGMSETTARRYREGDPPSQRKQPRKYRTRPDPFAAVWPEIETMLEQAPGLEAVTIFEALRRRADSRMVSCGRCSARFGVGGPRAGRSAR